ncbi:D-alanine--D-alanine ligase [Myxococcota bacterium]|nr:D-alanine--D-alanine ligase [Myxococcota bacterium]MBU1430903.1 D-alanine--D-alanine ligase [Myxococcota bacterium]MBU1897858.1 D-alanine--D-alanine ligase [Myxococcota bacterium]
MSTQSKQPEPVEAFALSGRFKGARIGVVEGGPSSERAVSQATGAAIAGALRARGYDVAQIDADRALPRRLSAARVDVVFNALHGTYGEDGRIQGLLDWLGMPYTGSGQRASLLAFDKALAKGIFREAAIPTLPHALVTAAAAAPPLPPPLVIKPLREGSSVGVSIVEGLEAWPRALAAATAGGGLALVEPYQRGVEVQVAVLDDQALGAVEIEPANAFYDYEAKYQSNQTRYHLPPRIPAAALAQIEAAAVTAHRALGCQGVTRSDFIYTGEARFIMLELNTLPGMTATSLVPKIAARRGLAFEALIERVLEGARHEGWATPTTAG